MENPEMSASLCCTLLFLGFIEFVSAGQKIITVGENVTLPCQTLSNDPITVVEWSRADLGDEHVLLFRNEEFEPEKQHPSFRNRVDLQDRQMKDGDVSLILKNVTTADNGTYKCQVVQSENKVLKLINTIQLSVVPPGQTGGHTEDGGKEDGPVGLAVGLSVFGLFLVAVVVVVGFFIYRKQTAPGLDMPAAEEHL